MGHFVHSFILWILFSIASFTLPWFLSTLLNYSLKFISELSCFSFSAFIIITKYCEICLFWFFSSLSFRGTVPIGSLPSPLNSLTSTHPLLFICLSLCSSIHFLIYFTYWFLFPFITYICSWRFSFEPHCCLPNLSLKQRFSSKMFWYSDYHW